MPSNFLTESIVMKKNVRKAKYQEFEKSNPERKDEKFGEKGIRGESGVRVGESSRRAR